VKKSLKTRLKSAMKGQPAWTLDEALAQLRLYPKDAYLQYVALQLARREHRVAEIAGQIEGLIGDEARQMRNERASRVELFSIFTGALAVQESLQLDAMGGDVSARQRNRPMLAPPPPEPPRKKPAASQPNTKAESLPPPAVPEVGKGAQPAQGAARQKAR